MKTEKESPRSIKSFGLRSLAILLGIGGTVILAYFVLPEMLSVSYGDASIAATSAAAGTTTVALPPVPVLDVADYSRRILLLANYATATTSTATSTATSTPAKHLWPPKTVLPEAGALLPFNRIVAYYGNFFSKGMGVLGQYPEAVMLDKLKSEVAVWEAADPATPVIPAIEYIDVTAQGSPGKDGKYRLRMPDDQIDNAIRLAKEVNGIVILDIQVGLSTLPQELPLLNAYLQMPQVHLAIDPEFAMHGGVRPGRAIGSFSATDINYAANFLAALVDKYNLPPKILVVHRFTEDMVTYYRQITPLPQVQIVMDMDGWGFPAKKINTYNSVIFPEPVQFTGLKLFYKNDLLSPSTAMLTPAQIHKLRPKPIYIQYQ